MGRNDDEVKIRTIRKARRAFLPEYVCGVFLLVLWVILYFKGIKLNVLIQILFLGAGMIAIISGEASRLLLRYRITNKKIIIIHGLFKQLKKNIYFHPLAYVPDINIHQNRLQRILGYGTIFVKGGSGVSFEIKDVAEPHKVMDLIEELMESNKKDNKMPTR